MKSESPFSHSSLESSSSPQPATPPASSVARPLSAPGLPPDLAHLSLGKTQSQEEVTRQLMQKQRFAGAMMLAGALALGYFFALRPLQEAARGASSLSLEMKGVAITPFLLIYGLLYVLAPNFVLAHLGGHGSRLPKTAIGWGIFAVALASGFLFWFWMEAQLRAYGYRI